MSGRKCHPSVLPVDGIDPCGNVPTPPLGPWAVQAAVGTSKSFLNFHQLQALLPHPIPRSLVPQCPIPVQIPPSRRSSYLFLVTKSIPTASINILGMAEKIDCLISRHRVKL